MAKQNAIGAMAVTNSYNCGVVGYHMERIANAGMVALGFVNAPASIAPWGGTKAVFGTNPIACAIPRRGAPPMVLDQSSSVVAKSEVIVHSQKDEAIPEGWAFDKDGNPTTNPKVALDGGTMVPSGGYKGAGLALLVEIMAVGLTGATWSSQASSFADNSWGATTHRPVLHGNESRVLRRCQFFRTDRVLIRYDVKSRRCTPSRRSSSASPPADSYRRRYDSKILIR
jgi:(2R)-3-sulfolactate dehydrogenase (NADP+)